MTSDIALACIVLLPIALIVVLRVNATLVFLSLCLGDVLNQFLGTNASSLTNIISSSQVTKTLHPNEATWRLLLLLLPVVITLLIMVHTIKSGPRMLLNLLPAIGVGLVGALLVVPLLPSAAAQDIINSSTWGQITRFQSLIVGITALACLSVLWLQRPKSSGKHSKHAG